jgi:hypothetical protein
MDGAELLAGGHAIGRRLGNRHQELLLQAGDSDLEELIEVLTQNGEEAHAPQQWEASILGHGKYPMIEVELGKLAVQVPALEVRAGRESRFDLELDFPHRYKYMNAGN